MSEDDYEVGQEPDAAAEAFEDMRGELALLRRAVERLSAERAEIPEPVDYSETLGQMAIAIAAVARRSDVLAKAAKDGVAPRYVADRIVAAGSDARAEDRRMIATASKNMDDAALALRSAAASARRSDEQKRMLMKVAIGGAVAGVALWAVLPGVVARSVPAGWSWPEKMAARTLGMEMWEGGARLLKTASPGGFADIAAGNRIMTTNRKALDACRKRANKAGEPLQCSVTIDPD